MANNTLRSWLEKHAAARVTEGKIGNSPLEGYLVNGRFLIVMRDPDGAANLFIPAANFTGAAKGPTPPRCIKVKTRNTGRTPANSGA